MGKLDEMPKTKTVVKKGRVVTGEVVGRGRPTTFGEAVAQQILERVMAGQTLYKLCMAPDMPSRETIYQWLVKHPDFADNYARACLLRREQKFEALEEIVDREEDVNRARLKVDVIKWQLSKEDPRKYGDKVDLTTNGKDLPSPLLGGIVIDDKALEG